MPDAPAPLSFTADELESAIREIVRERNQLSDRCLSLAIENARLRREANGIRIENPSDREPGES